MPTTNDEQVHDVGLRDIEKESGGARSCAPRVDDPAVGRQVAAMLGSYGHHPVMIIGTPGAGKSTLLASLLAYAYGTAQLDLQLGRVPLYPAAHPLRDAVHSQTRRIYEIATQKFERGLTVGCTGFVAPFYVPIEMRPRDRRLDPVRFAFLECRGEEFELVRHTESLDGSELLMRKELPASIAEVLRNFIAPISFIYVAPGRLPAASEGRIADLALLHGIESCQEIRAASGLDRRDKHLFLLSMWDTYTQGITTASFARPGSGEVERVLAAKFPNAWRKYSNLRAFGEGSQNYVMQYSVGQLEGSQSPGLDETSLRILDRYPRTLLNWLYGNARDGKVLFADVVSSARPTFDFASLARRLMGRER